jgi:hypothetical protein
MKTTKRTSSAVDQMDLYSLCRWSSLKDAIDIIGEKCEEKHLDFDSVEIKPLDLLKYVDYMTDEVYRKALSNKYSS